MQDVKVQKKKTSKTGKKPAADVRRRQSEQGTIQEQDVASDAETHRMEKAHTQDGAEVEIPAE